MDRIIVRALQAIEAQGDQPARAIGDEFEIALTDYDATRHEALRAATPAQPAGAIAPQPPTIDMEALGRAIGEGLRETIVQENAQQLRERGAGQVGRPAIDPLPGMDAATVPAGSAARATPAWADRARYARLPENERAIRSPESDYFIKEWVHAQLRGDVSGMREACDRSGGAQGGERALSAGTATDGAELVPIPLAAIIIEKRLDVEVIGPNSRIFTSPNQQLRVPVVSTNMTGAAFAENATITETDPQWAEVGMSKVKIATATRSSRELLDFSPFDVSSHIAELGGNAIGRAIGAADADGTTFTDSLYNSSAVTAGPIVTTLDTAQIQTLIWDVPSRYRPGSVFVGHPTVLALMSALTDAVAGRNIWQPFDAEQMTLATGQGGVPAGRFLGYPVYEEPGAVATELVFGNLQFYGSLQGGTVGVEASTTAGTAFVNHQVIWKFWEYRDGAVLQGEAFAKATAI